jgi:hypothetical protein
VTEPIDEWTPARIAKAKIRAGQTQPIPGWVLGSALLAIELRDTTIADLRAELDRLRKREGEWAALLPKCRESGCANPATRAYPTAELGYYVKGCDLHPQGPERTGDDEGFDAVAYDLPQAALLRTAHPR